MNATEVSAAIAKENARLAREGGDAFPRHQDDYGGLTKREYMAARCAPTCLAMLDGPTDFATVARNAVALADALLLELAKP